MSAGPITIFDKSALQSLSVDDAVLFGQFYRSVITPLFFVETMADLEKEVANGKTPEQVVGTIAAKTANLTADPCAHHDRLVTANLFGSHILMDGRPHIVGGRPVNVDGKGGIVFDKAPEAEALHRWQRHQFLEIERGIARKWRETLRGLRPPKLDTKAMFTPAARPRSLAQAKRVADRFIRQGGPSFIEALDLLGVPPHRRGEILLRWLDVGAPPIHWYAPYAAFVASIQLFFQLSVSLGLISGERPSNAVDIAYLFYLPFCMVFTSSDRLHAATAPLFMRADQVFLPGKELQTDLKKLDQYFSAQPQEVLDRGVMYFEPPFDGEYVTTQLWKRFLPGWRERRGDLDVKIAPEREAELVAQINAAIEAPEGPPVTAEAASFMAIQRLYPVTMGKWRIMAQDVAERSWAHEREKQQAKERPPE